MINITNNERKFILFKRIILKHSYYQIKQIFIREKWEIHAITLIPMV